MMSSCRIISIGNDEDDDDGGCVLFRCSLWVITVVGSAVEYLGLGHPFIHSTETSPPFSALSDISPHSPFTYYSECHGQPPPPPH